MILWRSGREFFPLYNGDRERVRQRLEVKEWVDESKGRKEIKY